MTSEQNGENDIPVFTRPAPEELANQLFNSLTDCLALISMYQNASPSARMRDDTIESMIGRAKEVRRRVREETGHPFA